MAKYRSEGGTRYSEDNPRVKFTAIASGGNITWVGLLKCEGSVNLIESDTQLKIMVPHFQNWQCTVTIDDVQIDNFKIGSEIEKIYTLKKNTKAKVTVVNNTSGDVTRELTCMVW